MACYQLLADGIILSVRLTPRADRDAIEGVSVLSDGRAVVLARVRAVAEKGAANEALVALVAKALNRPKSRVSIESGATARLKQVRVAGDAGEMSRRVDGWPGKPSR